MNKAELVQLDAYWRAANYLSVGQIYLRDNPLLREPLQRAHLKRRLLGHWGTTPGLNFIYAHMNRVIRSRDLDVMYVAGPGHGGPGVVANVYLEGVYSEVYPEISRDVDGLRRLFRQFSFPGGIPSHVAPETPGSIHEGGELGYALSHAYGAVFDNPNLLVCCVVGDGEAETGPLATSWHSNKFINPVRDGAVLPILHLNGYKISGPTVLARIPRSELRELFRGYGYTPYFVEGDDPAVMHAQMAETLDRACAAIADIQREARADGFTRRPAWPMIVLELFEESGALRADLQAFAPSGDRRMGANLHANGGSLLRPLALPPIAAYAVTVPEPGRASAEATRVQGGFIRDVISKNLTNFRVFSPDETTSNRWGAVFDVTDRASVAEHLPTDEHVGPDGRVLEMLSEHQCQGWLEGYLLTGRHGFFSCYEAFIHIIDSMFNQHAKWLKVSREIPWRRPIASLNYLLTSHVWRQDHNGFSHQDPGFIDHVVNKKSEVIRVYLPADANTLLVVTDHCLRSRNYINVVVAGKQPMPQWLALEDAQVHCAVGLGIWEWASSPGRPDVVLGCCGDVPTLEILAAADLLRAYAPDLRVRVVNVVDLMRLQSAEEHPHGLSDRDFDSFFTEDKPIIFAFHGYPTLIHRLTYRRTNHSKLHVRGYKEEGTTTTPFDMTVLNDMDRFHLVIDVAERTPELADRAPHLRREMEKKRIEHHDYIRTYGDDLPEIRDWTWGYYPALVGATQ